MASTSVAQPGPGRRLVGTERALYDFSRLSPLNLVVLVRLDGPALDDLLPQALAAAQARHPLLRASICDQRSGPRFAVRPADDVNPIALRFVSAPMAVRTVVESELRTPFDVGTGPLARLTCIRDVGAAGDLVLTLHHAIADGASAANLVHELLGWCGARLAGDDPPPPLPPAGERDDLPPPLTEVLPATSRGLRGLRAALALAARQGRDELTYRLGNPRRPVPPPGEASTMALRLDRNATTSLVARARRSRLTMTSVLCAALLWEASATLYRSRPATMRAVVWVDLRRHLSPPVPATTLACYVSMLRFVIKVDPREGFAPLARAVQRRVERAARRRDRMSAAATSAALARVATRFPIGRLGTTALSYSPAPAIGPRYGPVAVRDVQGFVSNIRLGAELAASAGVSDGELWCNVLYLDSDIDQATAAAAADGLLATLRQFAQGPAEPPAQRATTMIADDSQLAQLTNDHDHGHGAAGRTDGPAKSRHNGSRHNESRGTGS